MTTAASKFIIELESVSPELGKWASDKIVRDGWTIDQVKAELRTAMKIAERN